MPPEHGVVSSNLTGRAITHDKQINLAGKLLRRLRLRLSPRRHPWCSCPTRRWRRPDYVFGQWLCVHLEPEPDGLKKRAFLLRHILSPVL